MLRTEAFQVGGPTRDYQLREDSIHIFLNFQKVAEVKSKAEAVSILTRLVEGCPRESLSDFEEFKELLFRNVR